MTTGNRAARVPRNGGDGMAPIDYLAKGLVEMTDAELSLVTVYVKDAREGLAKLDQYATLSALDGACSILLDTRARFEAYLQAAAQREAEAIRRGPTRAELRRR